MAAAARELRPVEIVGLYEEQKDRMEVSSAIDCIQLSLLAEPVILLNLDAVTCLKQFIFELDMTHLYKCNKLHQQQWQHAAVLLMNLLAMGMTLLC